MALHTSCQITLAKCHSSYLFAMRVLSLSFALMIHMTHHTQPRMMNETYECKVIITFPTFTWSWMTNSHPPESMQHPQQDTIKKATLELSDRPRSKIEHRDCLLFCFKCMNLSTQQLMEYYCLVWSWRNLFSTCSVLRESGYNGPIVIDIADSDAYVSAAVIHNSCQEYFALWKNRRQCYAMSL